ncbi:hypothetical protein ACQPYK_49510 (plasmid) [Streptosporangium sp. CA-135522]|uniref:hypothetical protein n=1 Tax=Streptosporangium sp. CA-135522 TaxID=3240072 RepID=UPI003D8EC982
MTTTANDLLMAGGLKSASFLAMGTTVGGRVIRLPEPVQQTEFGTGKVKVWDDGTPRMQVVVHLATNERRGDIPNDNGHRALYVKGRMRLAVRDAIRRTGATGLTLDGWLSVTYVGDDEPTIAGGKPPKLYVAEYAPPAGAANAVLMAAEPADAARVPAAVPVGVSAPISTAPAMGVSAPISTAPAMSPQQLLQALAAQSTMPTIPAPPAPTFTPPAVPPTPAPAAAAAPQPDPELLAHLAQLSPEVLAQLGLSTPSS